jgi:disulfide bond formation protein DsbB
MCLMSLSNRIFSYLFFFLLKLTIYSNSKVLVMTFLSLYGSIQGIAHAPRSGMSAVKSLLQYGVEVFQHGL